MKKYFHALSGVQTHVDHQFTMSTKMLQLTSMGKYVITKEITDHKLSKSHNNKILLFILLYYNLNVVGKRSCD